MFWAAVFTPLLNINLDRLTAGMPDKEEFNYAIVTGNDSDYNYAENLARYGIAWLLKQKKDGKNHPFIVSELYYYLSSVIQPVSG